MGTNVRYCTNMGQYFYLTQVPPILRPIFAEFVAPIAIFQTYITVNTPGLGIIAMKVGLDRHLLDILTRYHGEVRADL